MLNQIRLRPFYFIPVFALLLFALFFSLFIPKENTFQLLNSYHNRVLDQFFIMYTWVGDGLFILAIVVLLALFGKRKEAVILFFAYASSGLVTQLLKHTFDQPRPSLYFTQSKIAYDHFVKGVILHSSNSFPSGHATTAFAVATVIALFYHSKVVSIAAFVFALLAAYSRIYLGQHFLHDVTAGAFTGVFFSMLTYQLLWHQMPAFLRIFDKKANRGEKNDNHPISTDPVLDKRINK